MKKLMLTAVVLSMPVLAVQADEVALFEKLDADKSATISQEEAQGHPGLAKMFEQLDANTDGEIDAKEFEAVVKSDS